MERQSEYNEVEEQLVYWANCYYCGTGGVAQDKEQAYQLYAYLVDADCDTAYVLLARIYEQGEPELVEQNLPKALELYQHAADELEDKDARQKVAQWHLLHSKPLMWFGLPLNATIGKGMKLPKLPRISFNDKDGDITWKEEKLNIADLPHGRAPAAFSFCITCAFGCNCPCP